MKRFWISLVAAGLLMMAALAPAAAQDTVDIDLEEIDDSGVTGTATLTAENGTTMVSIEISGGPDDGVHPVHFHDGTCDDLGGVAYPLEDIEDGTSESTVEVSLADLQAGVYAINIHLSADEMSTFVACGDVPTIVEDDDAAEDDAVEEDDEDDDTEEVVPAAGSTGGVSTETAVVLMTLLAGAALGTGLLVRRRAYRV